MLDMALNAVRFFRNESCGKCVPCRVGSQKMVDILTGWTQGRRGHRRHAAARRTVARRMKLTSICGLGQIAHVADHVGAEAFPPEVEAHICEQSLSGGRLLPMRGDGMSRAMRRDPADHRRQARHGSRRHHGLRRRAHSTASPSHAVPPAERNARRRVPRMRRRCRRARSAASCVRAVEPA